MARYQGRTVTVVPTLPALAVPAMSVGCCNEPIVDDWFRGLACSWCTTPYALTDVIDPVNDDDGPSVLITVGITGTTVYIITLADLLA